MVISDNILKVKDNGFENRTLFSEQKFIFNKQYELIADEDIEILHCKFKKGEPLKVSGALTKLILESTDKVKLYKQPVVSEETENILEKIKELEKKLEESTKKPIKSKNIEE